MWWSLLACTQESAAESPEVPTLSPVDVVGIQKNEEQGDLDTVGSVFPPPTGTVHVVGSVFGESLRDLRLRSADLAVRTFDGYAVGHHARVIDLPLVSGDLQQCADSILRVRAEWERAQGRDPMFHATSGDPIPWTKYRSGQKPYESGQHLAWKAGGTGDWDGWLSAVFMWAGTRSLAYDSTAVTEPQPGDFVVAPGSPGHAVLLLDVAKRGDELWVLVGEGYMPAQDFHVEIGEHQGWWKWDQGVSLDHWTLPATGLRRFPE